MLKKKYLNSQDSGSSQCHNVLERGAEASPSAVAVQKCLNLLHDDLGLNTNKLWIVNQSIEVVNLNSTSSL